MSAVGLIAGNGRFPLLFLREARLQGVDVVTVAHEGESLPEIAEEASKLTWIKVGELGKIIQTFKVAGVERAVMCGGIRKEALLEHFAPDERGMQFLSRLTTLGDDTILRGLASELESEGIPVVESTLFLDRLLAPRGALTSTQPNEEQWKDIRYGFEVAKGVGQWDIGQSILVKQRIVLAVEAIEGTDATIQRAGRPGAIVVKVSKPNQDMRFDVPAIGPHTIQTCTAAKIAVLAIEAGKTLLIDREEILQEAEAAGLALVGI